MKEHLNNSCRSQLHPCKFLQCANGCTFKDQLSRHEQSDAQNHLEMVVAHVNSKCASSDVHIQLSEIDRRQNQLNLELAESPMTTISECTQSWRTLITCRLPYRVCRSHFRSWPFWSKHSRLPAIPDSSSGRSQTSPDVMRRQDTVSVQRSLLH